MSAQILEVSLLGVGTVLRLERDAWSMVKWPRQATNEYAPLPPSPSKANDPLRNKSNGDDLLEKPKARQLFPPTVPSGNAFR